jgi:tetratricopeptide (TPR) repeat protein
MMARHGARSAEALAHFEQAMALFEEAGASHPRARVSARLGEVEWRRGHLDEALERMEGAFEVLSGDEPDADLATLAAELGRLHFFKGEGELAARRIDAAIEIAEALWLPEVLSQALNTQGLIASWSGRSEQAIALLKHALEIALEHDLTAAALRAYNNLGDRLDRRDRYEEAIDLHRRGITLARKAGDRIQGWRLLGELSWCLLRTGQWTEALEVAAEVPEDQFTWALSLPNTLIEIASARGDVAEAKRVLARMSHLKESADVQERTAYAAVTATVLRAEERYEEALSASEEALAASELLGAGVSVDTKIALSEALESALALGRLDAVEELVKRIDAIPPGKRPPFLWAQSARFRARLAAARGEHDGVEQGVKTAAAIFREHGLTFHLAATELEHGEWLTGQGREEEAEPILAEAREIFERLEATPWLERADAARPGLARIGAEAD